MSAPVVIAIDAMSGDHGPSVCTAAACLALERHPALQIVLTGQPEVLTKILPALPPRLRIEAASEVVSMDESPARALRGKKDSSMRRALELLRDGQVQACVSAGNTGALVAKSRYLLKTLDGIDRPAIVSSIPAQDGHTCMLDLGANTDCSAGQLLQFAVMGSVLAEFLYDIPAPRVALLNIGVESIKGTASIRAADKLLRDIDLNYIGYVEGDQILASRADVIVTDGFTGNVALKSIEGACNQMLKSVQEEFSANPVRRALAGLFSPVFSSLRARLDPRRYNGASLVGLRGNVIKSHGGADTVAFSNAIDLAVLEAQNGVPDKIALRVATALSRQEAI